MNSKFKSFYYRVVGTISRVSWNMINIFIGKKNHIKQIRMKPCLNSGWQDHEHICIIARLLKKDFKLFCPYYNQDDFEPEGSGKQYDCDYCKYFGTILTNGNNLELHGHPWFVSAYGENQLLHIREAKQLEHKNIKDPFYE